MNKRSFFLIIWCVSFGILVWMFFTKLKGDLSSTEWFSTQSFDGISYLCPRNDQLMNNQRVIVANPVAEKANTIISIQSGLRSTNYEQAGPIWSSSWRKAVLNPLNIDDIKAINAGNQYYCEYYSQWKKIIQLRHDELYQNNCVVLEDASWFSCEH